jgi:ABC-type dipeptide/oligopeptide/nickel transport system permease subunit
MGLTLIIGITIGFAAGYFVRDMQSRRRRRLAEKYAPWPVPPHARL